MDWWTGGLVDEQSGRGGVSRIQSNLSVKAICGPFQLPVATLKNGVPSLESW